MAVFFHDHHTTIAAETSTQSCLLTLQQVLKELDESGKETLILIENNESNPRWGPIARHLLVVCLQQRTEGGD
jgi:hypothetical protein